MPNELNPWPLSMVEQEKKEKNIMNQAMLSSGKDDWETPKSFFDRLDAEFHFTLDACATQENTKCSRFFSQTDDGLSQDWGGETVFCNPPYSMSGKQDLWVKKALMESRKPGTTVVMLIPARTDTQRFHDCILGKADEIRFVRGRLVFEIDGKPILDKKGRPQPAPFPSMVVIFGREERTSQCEQ